MGWDAVCISLHENFANFSEFIRAHDSELSEWVVESQTFHSDLKAGIIIKPFHLKYLDNAKINQHLTYLSNQVKHAFYPLIILNIFFTYFDKLELHESIFSVIKLIKIEQ